MAVQQNFRNAFHGFNREDVVHYIEYLNSRHAAEISQLNAEMDYLRSHQPESDTEAVIAQQAARIQELEEELAQLKDGAPLPSIRSESEELEAYRRAERAERRAKERAELVYHQANGILADATAQVEEAAEQIGQLSDRVLEHLNELQAAVTGSRQALKDAATTMNSLRPQSDEE